MTQEDKIEFLQRVRTIRVDGNHRLEQVRVLLGNIEDVIIRNIKLSLLQIHAAVAMIILVECQQPMLAVTFNIANQARQPLDSLLIRALNVPDIPGAKIYFESELMNRMSPGQHPGIHKGAVRADTDPCDVRVI